MTSILRTKVLSQFSCLGDKCADTCCSGWSMQMDTPTLRRYKNEAPELLDAVQPAKETQWVMKRNENGDCVKLEGGLCSIHKKYGETFLGDACYFYPRAPRRLGGKSMMGAVLSCPEIARLALADDDAAMLEEVDAERLPHQLKDYLPQELTLEQALAIHQVFLDATKNKEATAEQIFLRIASCSRSLDRIDKKTWPSMVAFYLEHADSRLPPAQTNINDPFNLLHALSGLLIAAKKKPSARLAETISEMERGLAARLDWEAVRIETDDKSLPAYQRLNAIWKEQGAHYAPVLRRWLAMQLSLMVHPFGGFGNSLSDRVTIIGVRMATFKLALMCGCGIYGETLPQEAVARMAQSLSRVLDHLADPTFSMQIYAETGWTEETRMRGLLE